MRSVVCRRSARVLLPFALGVLLAACGGSAPPSSSGVAKAPQASSTSNDPRTVTRDGYSFEVAPAPAWVEAATIPDAWPAGTPGADSARWRNWLIDTQVDRRGGARVRYVDNAFEAVSAEWIGDAGKYQINFNPEYQRLQLHAVEVRRGGAWTSRLDTDRITLARRETDFEADMATGMVTALIVLDDVRPGDVVRLRYTVGGENPVLGGLDGESATFGWTDPIRERRLRILFDRDAEVAEYRAPDVAAAQVTRRGDMQEWLYKQGGIAATIEENGYPRWFSQYPRLRVSEKRTWAQVAAWARSLYPEPAPLPADLESRIEAWRQIEPPDARIAAVLTAVQEEIRYFGVEIGDSTHKSAEPATTWTRRYGDCKDKARLFATLLGRLGVEAYPALVSARNARAVADWPPGADAFDHVIVQVRLPEGVMWLDPTLTLQRGPLRSIGVFDAGVALPLAPDTNALAVVERAAQTIDRVRIVERFAVKDDARAIALVARTDLEGAAANRMRRDLQSQGREAVQRRYQEYYRRRYGEVHSDADLAVEDDEKANHVSLTERYTLVDPWAGDSPAERVLETWVETLGQEVALPGTVERKTPLALHYPAEVEQRAEVVVPKGWHWQGEPATMTLDDSAAEFESRTEVKDGEVARTQRYRAKADVVALDGMSAHLRWRRQVGDALGRRWSFDLPQKDADRERDRRLHALLRDLMERKNPQGAAE